MQIHNVKSHTKRKYGIKVGRGGKRGKSSGRGTKGQKARSGHKMRPEMRDIIKRIPKLRGRGINAFKPKEVPFSVVNLTKLMRQFPEGGKITPAILHEKRIVRGNSGTAPTVKILATGDVTVAFQIEGCEFSVAAEKKIVAAGGTIK